MEKNVVKSVSIDNLLNQREAILERVQKAHALLEEANQIVEKMLDTPESKKCSWRNTLAGICDYNFSFGDFMSGDGMKSVKTNMDANIWNFLMDESGLKTFMDSKTRAKWADQIDKKECPEITRENIEATFKTIHGSRKQMFEQGVVECFKRLSWDYKTNNPCKFGKKLIIERFMDTQWISLSPEQRRCDEMDDLIRVFHIFDDKPEPDHRGGTYSLVSDACKQKATTLSTEYLDLKWYKNGNVHIVIKKDEHIDKLNSIIADHFPHVLPPKKEK